MRIVTPFDFRSSCYFTVPWIYIYYYRGTPCLTVNKSGPVDQAPIKVSVIRW